MFTVPLPSMIPQKYKILFIHHKKTGLLLFMYAKSHIFAHNIVTHLTKFIIQIHTMTFNRFFGVTALLLTMLLAACSGGGKVSNEQFNFIEDLGITVNDKLLLPDTLTLPDIYCGDPEQDSEDIPGHKLSQDQYQALVVPAGSNIADAMSNWLLLGVRDMGDGITLGAFYSCNGLGYCVDLVTYDKQGKVLDAVNTREMHMLWRIDLSDNKNDSVFTLDSHITFDGDGLTLHRLMGRCVMDFEGEIKGNPLWQQQWDQRYAINAKGHFVLKDQQVIKEQGKIDYYAAMDFKSWDMLVCSKYDPSIMDAWNNFTTKVEETYSPDYTLNPFPLDVTQLYKMNPQRFLRWMALHRELGNKLLRYFKLSHGDRPDLLQEIARIDDPTDRMWLTSLVYSWDDKPLTKHL